MTLLVCKKEKWGEYQKPKTVKRELGENYNLLYIVNDRVFETILTNKSIQLCNMVKTQKTKQGNYKKENLHIISTYKARELNITI